ncbi:bifunctional 4-hydroxy-2-oxoglutarate aldolase/2-dehydro-3-deoxy-phosphogluconate aldolase [Paenibacillus thermotolerans]|uniref:bifunctional 4-hydroxy-2-oxoglutarate aldolase/2-dehydro-3-deoxy-phosphogluconate aldolase n=1 Tax=Paenibacillus thermotolerans TaxID=3027807 RepID=UPI0023689468|nr:MULTISPECIES: bifunctional 4-hydroxy-2-oxoglutarate aldolase/2-dehydro-3-deoxy-phosphogluconate aldolase [unclassified Paenibacillus]
MDLLKRLTEEKIIAIVRGIPEEKADAAASALYEGGIRLIEVTMNTPGALDFIRRWRKLFEGSMLVGAGTVLDVEMAKAAVAAGAEYLVTPNVDEAVIRYGAANCAGVFPGAMTPTEIVQAWKHGAAAVKLFPTASLGAKYIQELQGPLSHIPLIATGGVDIGNMEQYAKAGAKGFGLGSSLLNKQWIQEGDFERLKSNAAEYAAAARRL